jgi:tRNA threonylcarbamoyladenosine biosynthesis protein TsaE
LERKTSHPSPELIFTLHSSGPDWTQAVGEAIGAHAQPGDIVLVNGELGAGKTCLTQGVLRGLGSKDHVRSPTFVLVMEHDARIPLYHADLYRLESGASLDTVGLEEYLQGDGLCIVEWADRAPHSFPAGRLEICIELSEGGMDERELTLVAVGERHVELLGSVLTYEALDDYGPPR